ncbi:SDR family NAD(P)-dependent oxidoreductase [Leptospira vanthielii]|uniref:KR domain protein n=1 Tax=Leptospira vanthielii serovar Holland str. Waz Holland = ATCC 700522 TaxID=1218591 RepID=N1VZT4_9LEPT|nr:glucose 1-dehydrogenase [Leptospira vanthielii]EMY68293.1 KR domain protein [Leptospira vanthielii serovar Holland str. Waz Holland = ATCC 700522]
MLSLQEKTAVVTGGSQGIGAGIVRKLAKQGANVIFTYNSNKEAAERLIKEIEASVSKVVAVKVDVTKELELESLFDTASKQFGKIDILVNNAGVFQFLPIEASTLEEVNRQFGINVIAPILAIKAALKHFNDGGSIINIGSIVATMAPPNSVIYSSSKAAINGITLVLSKELAPRKIRVNQVNPGSIRTEGAQKAGMSPEAEEFMVKTIPMGRIGFPEDIANMTAFLASDEAEWITGEIMMVSGGAR